MRISPTATKEDNSLLARFIAAKEAADRANERLKKAQEVLLADMESRQEKSLKWNGENGLNTVTYVRQTRVVIDEKGLRKALTAKVFDKYTKKVLDKPLMEKAMSEGEIDPTVVAQHVTTKESSPYIKYTVTSKDEQ